MASSYLRRLQVTAYRVLSKLVPVTNQYCFISFPDIDDNALSIYAELLSRKSTGLSASLVWLVSDLDAARRRLLNRFGPECVGGHKVVRKNTLNGLWCFLRARRVFFTHGHYPFVEPSAQKQTKLINLWHGMPLKAIGMLDGTATREVQASDVTIASSEHFRPIMAEAFGLSYERVLLTGLPRCDGLTVPTAQAQEYRRGVLNEEDADKLVVWMPTYQHSIKGDIRADTDKTKEQLVERFVESLFELSAMCALWNVVLLVKLHPMDFLNMVDVPSVPRVRVLQVGSGVLQLLGTYDILAVGDGLITDVSSVSFDYMATRRPILINRGYVEDYSRPLVFDRNELFDAVFCTDHWGGAKPFFAAVLSGEILAADRVEKFCQFSGVGASRRVLDALDNL